MEKNILIVDNDSRQRLRIAKVVFGAASESSTRVKIYKVVNAKRAAGIFEQYDIDMLILNTNDHRMFSEDLPGIRLVEELRKREKYMFLPVIFISSQEEMCKYALIELNCLGYQPYEFKGEELKRIIQKGLHHTTRRDEEVELYLKSKSILYPVRINDIVYIESKNKELWFCLKGGSKVRVSYRTLLEVKEKMKNRYLLQCGRDIIINREYIEKVEERTVFLRNGEESIRLNIGVRYWDVAKTAIL